MLPGVLKSKPPWPGYSMGVFPPCASQCFLSRGIESISDHLLLAFAVSRVVFQNIRSLRGKDGKVEEIMLGLQDQLVADTEEAIRPQDRRRKLIKHDPIFLPGRRGNNTSVSTNTNTANTFATSG